MMSIYHWKLGDIALAKVCKKVYAKVQVVKNEDGLFYDEKVLGISTNEDGSINVTHQLCYHVETIRTNQRLWLPYTSLHLAERSRPFYGTDKPSTKFQTPELNNPEEDLSENDELDNPTNYEQFMQMGKDMFFDIYSLLEDAEANNERDLEQSKDRGLEESKEICVEGSMESDREENKERGIEKNKDRNADNNKKINSNENKNISNEKYKERCADESKVRDTEENKGYLNKPDILEKKFVTVYTKENKEIHSEGSMECDGEENKERSTEVNKEINADNNKKNNSNENKHISKEESMERDVGGNKVRGTEENKDYLNKPDILEKKFETEYTNENKEINAEGSMESDREENKDADNNKKSNSNENKRLSKEKSMESDVDGSKVRDTDENKDYSNEPEKKKFELVSEEIHAEGSMECDREEIKGRSTEENKERNADNKKKSNSNENKRISKEESMERDVDRNKVKYTEENEDCVNKPDILKKKFETVFTKESKQIHAEGSMECDREENKERSLEQSKERNADNNMESNSNENKEEHMKRAAEESKVRDIEENKAYLNKPDILEKKFETVFTKESKEIHAEGSMESDREKIKERSTQENKEQNAENNKESNSYENNYITKEEYIERDGEESKVRDTEENKDYLNKPDIVVEKNLETVFTNGKVSEEELENYYFRCWRYKICQEKERRRALAEGEMSSDEERSGPEDDSDDLEEDGLYSDIEAPAEEYSPPKPSIHASWCLVCGKEGTLIECPKCPSSYHYGCREKWIVTIFHRMEHTEPQTLNTYAQEILTHSVSSEEHWKDAQEKDDHYLCPSCTSGPRISYNDIVWHKYGSCPWWPARVLPSDATPSWLTYRAHYRGQLPLRYYGTLDHSWASVGRMCMFLPWHVEGRQSGDPDLRQAYFDACDDYIAIYLT